MSNVIPNLVSTIIPVYNRPVMLRLAVTSVLNQAYRPIQIIVVDDGSTDDTLQVAHELREKHPDLIKVATKENSGPGPTPGKPVDCWRKVRFFQHLAAKP